MIDSKKSDSELVSQFANGREAALETLLQRHKNRVFSVIYHIVKDRYVAEDLLQETFIKAFKVIRSGKYNDEGKFLPWICRIGNNLAIDHYRKTRRNPHVTLKDGSRVMNTLEFSEDSIEDLRIAAETHAYLRECIKHLPAEQHRVLIMRHYEELTFQEIADITGVSINTALGRMRYALINIRKLMLKHQIAYDGNLYPKRPDPVSVPRDLERGKPAA